MGPPGRVLASNAPALNNDGRHSSRVLQEHSNSRRNSFCSQVTTPDHKYPSSLLMDNSYIDTPVQHTQHIHREPSQRQQHSRHGRSGHRRNLSDASSNEKIARSLYLRFRASDQYMKYRERQHRDPQSSEHKWPDHLEVAFFQALVQWPPMGRRQLPHKGKQRGRNELIADFIEEVTGESRTRKQVSSHIQVLKPFVDHDPFIMKWLAQDFSKADQNRFYGRQSSYYDAAAASNRSRAVRNSQGSSRRCLRKTLRLKDSLDVFEPQDFSIFVQRKHARSDGEVSQRLHTYTNSIAAPLQPDEYIHDWQSLQQSLPRLYDMLQENRLDCNVLLAEASLGFPENTFQDEHGIALPNVELGTSFLCKSRHLPAHAVVKCHNSFWQDDQLLEVASADVHLAQSEHDNSIDAQLKFGSLFWANTLAFITTKLDSDAEPETTRQGVMNYICNLTAIQEIFVMSESQQPERLLVIHWKFRLSHARQGRAYWRRLHLPDSSPQPHHSTQNKSQTVDSVLDYCLDYTPSPSQQQQPQFTPPPSYNQPLFFSPYDYTNSPGPSSTTNSWPTSSFSDFGSSLDNTPHWPTSGGTDQNSFDFDLSPVTNLPLTNTFPPDHTPNFVIDPCFPPDMPLLGPDCSVVPEFSTSTPSGGGEWCDPVFHHPSSSSAGIMGFAGANRLDGFSPMEAEGCLSSTTPHPSAHESFDADPMAQAYAGAMLSGGDGGRDHDVGIDGAGGIGKIDD